MTCDADLQQTSSWRERSGTPAPPVQCHSLTACCPRWWTAAPVEPAYWGLRWAGNELTTSPHLGGGGMRRTIWRSHLSWTWTAERWLCPEQQYADNIYGTTLLYLNVQRGSRDQYEHLFNVTLSWTDFQETKTVLQVQMNRTRHLRWLLLWK